LTVNATSTFNTDVDLSLGDAENLALTSTSNSSLSVAALNITQADDADATDNLVGLDLALTNNSGDAGDTFTGLRITNANTAANQITDALITLDNAETSASTVTDGILITSSGVNDGIIDAIDVSAANITNAINVGANTILGTTADLDFSNFDVTGVSGDITSAGDLALNGGDLTSTAGTFNLINTNTTTLNI